MGDRGLLDTFEKMVERGVGGGWFRVGNGMDGMVILGCWIPCRLMD